MLLVWSPTNALSLGRWAPNDYDNENSQLTPDWWGDGRLKILSINDLGQPGFPKCLIVNDLDSATGQVVDSQQLTTRKIIQIKFDFITLCPYVVSMKARKTKTPKLRLQILFTKARPHKDKSRYSRKAKHVKLWA